MSQRCYSCGEYEAVWVSHGGDDDSHLYCRNCDNGLCPKCCGEGEES